MKTVRLADPSHVVPWPGVPGRVLTGAETVSVDDVNPFWAALIRDGSVVEIPAPAPAAATPAKEEKR